MTEGVELTLKQILDSAWVRRLGRLGMILTPILLSGVGGTLSWIMVQNLQASERAVVSSKMAMDAVEAMKKTIEAQDKVAEEQRKNDVAWRTHLDSRVDRLGQRVDILASSIGELKGLIIRQNASADFGPDIIAPRFPAGRLR